MRAIFPAVLVLVSILGLLGQSTTDQILTNIKELAPESVSGFLNTLINPVQGKPGAASIAGIAGLLASQIGQALGIGDAAVLTWCIAK